MRNYIAMMLRNAREDANMKQIEVAKKLSVNNKSVSHWEKATAMPCVEDIIKLADLYGISIDALLGHKVKNDNRIALSIEEFKLIYNYRKLNDKGKADLSNIAESFSCNPVYTEKEKVTSIS